MEQPSVRVVWRFAGMRPGALCVMASGQHLMQQWPADSLASYQLVCVGTSHFSMQTLLCTSVADHSDMTLLIFHRSYATVQCLLWSGNWSHPPG